MELIPKNLKAIVFSATNQVEIREIPMPEIGMDGVRVKTLYTMVSSGTELRVFSGRGEADRQFPLIPGYVVVGEVVEVGPEAQGWKVGDLVSGRNPITPAAGLNLVYGGQQSYHVYPAKGDCQPVLLPEGADPLDYAVAEIAAISLRGVDLADPQPGETAVVVGQGLIGALSAGWLAAAGCRVIVVDRAAARLARAARWNVAATVNASEEDVHARLTTLLPQGADIVVEASASVAGLKTAQAALRRMDPVIAQRPRWPRLIIQASFSVEVPTNPGDFSPGEGTLVLTPGDRRLPDRAKAIEGLRTGRLRGKDFLDKIVPYTDAPASYALLRDDPNACFSLVFDWSTAAR
ncbi:MAG: zinc-binding dehydrogenase [Janthinobacterium lividum]